MGKGALKFGGKSGVLPVVRQIFKQPIEPVKREIDPNVGYAKNVLAPRGASREQKPLPVYTVSDRIAKTVKAPKVEYDPKEFETLDPKQKERVAKAQIRRKYYADSLKHEEQRLKTDKIKEEKLQKLKEAREQSNIVEETPAAKLTLPTIASYLDGPLMRQRTQEEKELLLAKRRANRLSIDFNHKLNSASKLLRLYYSAESFVTNEKDLHRAVEEAFTPGNEIIALINPEQRTYDYNGKVGDALFGTLDNRPGLPRIFDQITGENAKLKERIDQAAKKRLAEQRDAELSN